MTGFRLAMIQMAVEGGEAERNLARAVRKIAEAGADGARVVVLPEALDLGWTHPSALVKGEPIPDGSSCRTLRDAAVRHGVYVCAGLTERAGAETFNAAVLIAPDGAVILHHRKLNELEIGHPFYEQGDRLGVVRTELACFGVMICADAFARGQIVSRTLGLMGVDVILSPCAWAVPADHDQEREPYGGLWLDSYGPVARDFAMTIVGVSNVGPIVAGPWSGRRCIGCSLAVGPDGAPLAQAAYGVDAECILLIDVGRRPRPARGDGWSRDRADTNTFESETERCSTRT